MKYRLALAFIVLGVFALALLSLRGNVSSAPDFPERVLSISDVEVIIEIPAGASGADIGKLLFNNKVIKSSDVFFRLAVGDKRSEKIAPGPHRLTQNISAQQALNQLLDAKRMPALLKIIEGQWKSEIIKSLIIYGFKQSEVSQAVKSLVLPRGFTNPEGLLFPAQYSFVTGTGARTMLQSMIDRFESEPSGRAILATNGRYSSRELLTIASIVQAEGDGSNFGKVARVILNRLRISMPLQMDSTVHYIKGERGNIFLSTQSTLIQSPYNTYRKYGLPPGPISNPGADAMAATLNPPAGDWLYFVTVAPGDTRFSASHEEFLVWKALYAKNRKAGAFN